MEFFLSSVCFDFTGKLSDVLSGRSNADEERQMAINLAEDRQDQIWYVGREPDYNSDITVKKKALNNNIKNKKKTSASKVIACIIQNGRIWETKFKTGIQPSFLGPSIL